MNNAVRLPTVWIPARATARAPWTYARAIAARRTPCAEPLVWQHTPVTAMADSPVAPTPRGRAPRDAAAAVRAWS